MEHRGDADLYLPKGFEQGEDDNAKFKLPGMPLQLLQLLRKVRKAGKKCAAVLNVSLLQLGSKCVEGVLHVRVTLWQQRFYQLPDMLCLTVCIGQAGTQCALLWSYRVFMGTEQSRSKQQQQEVYGYSKCLCTQHFC